METLNCRTYLKFFSIFVRNFLFFPTVVILGVKGEIFSYSLKEHEWLTRRAISEFSQCSGIGIDEGLNAAAVEGNLDEDINALRKWLAFSHYYNPYKPINNDHRKNAMARVRQLAGKFKEKTDFPVINQEFFRLAGRLMHYVQDVTGPAHVVPVRHSENEGFEDYEIKNLDVLFQELEPSPCQDQNAQFPLLEKIFDDTAQLTLQTLGGDFLAQCDNGQTTFSWDDIWVGHEGPYYGHYGMLGNVFGEENFIWQDQSCHVDSISYDAYKLRQLRTAVDSSRLILEWIWHWSKS